jgi:hypothetical protein
MMLLPESGGSSTPRPKFANFGPNHAGDACPIDGDGTSMELGEAESLLKIAQSPT